MSESEIGIFALRELAYPIALRLKKEIGGHLLCGWSGAKSPTSVIAACFHDYKNWILIMASGIAVRCLCGLLEDKRRDPGVVVLDEGCHHAIALSGGHEGGANQLAYKVANAVGAEPVVTTASEALKPLIVGIGARRGVSARQIEQTVVSALGERDISEVRALSTIDLKAGEPGLLEFAAKWKLPLRVLCRAAVAERAWVTKPSSWVRQQIGVAGVCEPCALMAAPRGKLVTPKYIRNGVAVAVVDDGAKSWLAD